MNASEARTLTYDSAKRFLDNYDKQALLAAADALIKEAAEHNCSAVHVAVPGDDAVGTIKRFLAEHYRQLKFDTDANYSGRVLIAWRREFTIYYAPKNREHGK